jgi:hypothetical protein
MHWYRIPRMPNSSLHFEQITLCTCSTYYPLSSLYYLFYYLFYYFLLKILALRT